MLNIKWKIVTNVTFFTLGNKSILYFGKIFISSGLEKSFMTDCGRKSSKDDNLNVAFRLNISAKF